MKYFDSNSAFSGEKVVRASMTDPGLSAILSRNILRILFLNYSNDTACWRVSGQTDSIKQIRDARLFGLSRAPLFCLTAYSLPELMSYNYP